jgi:hypothetical protein
VLHHGDDPFFDMAVSGWMLAVTYVNAGTMAKILTDSGKRVEMARGLRRPTGVVVAPACIAWIEQIVEPDPVRGAPFVAQRSVVAAFEPGAPVALREAPGSAFSLVADEEHLYWCEVEGGRSIEVWRAAHRPRGAAERLAVMEPRREGAAWWPRLAVNARSLVWVDPDRRAVMAVDKQGGGAPVVLGETGHAPVGLVADDHDVFVLAVDPASGEGHLEHVPAGGGAAKEIASYARPAWDRPSMAMDRRGVYFTTQDRVLRIGRA